MSVSPVLINIKRKLSSKTSSGTDSKSKIHIKCNNKLGLIQLFMSSPMNATELKYMNWMNQKMISVLHDWTHTPISGTKSTTKPISIAN
jgi:hypothetical protein